MIRLVLILAIIWVVWNSVGKQFDKYCIKGKVLEHQIIAVQKYPGTIVAGPGDRILRGGCSDLVRKLTLRNQYEAVLDFIGL